MQMGSAVGYIAAVLSLALFISAHIVVVTMGTVLYKERR